MDRLRETLRETLRQWGGTLATVAVVGVVVGFTGMILLGGQISSVLGPVGAALPARDELSNPDAGGGGDVTVDDPASDRGGGAAGDAGGAAAAIALREESRLVYTGTLRLVVEDVAASADQARGLVAQAGGYLGGSRTSTNEGTPVAELTFRIPSAEWESTLSALRGLATDVTGEETRAVEVGGQLVDLEARAKNLRASEAVLQSIAGQAGSIADLVRVQGELTTVRGEIERLEAQRALLESQVAYGTLVVTLGVEAVIVEHVAEAWSPATDVEAATDRLVSILQTLTGVGIWLAIVWLPLALLALLVGRAAWSLGTRVLRRTGILPGAVG